MKKKRMSDYREETTIDGKIGIGGTGIGGTSKRLEIDILEYERHLHSMREAKEKMPNLPLDEEFLKHAGHLYADLSETGKNDLQFLIEGQKMVSPPKYQPGTNAIWVVPFVTELLKEYKRIIDGEKIHWKDNIPFYKNYPIGVRIILSQYKGLLIFFTKKSTSIDFLTWSVPLNGNFNIDDRPMNINDDTHLRVRTDDDKETIWKMACGSEDEQYFSIERAKEEACQFAKADILYYRP